MWWGAALEEVAKLGDKGGRIALEAMPGCEARELPGHAGKDQIGIA